MDFFTSLNIYRILSGGAPGPCPVLRFNGGPIAADLNHSHAPEVRGVTSQMAVALQEICPVGKQ
ncbi:hypothetical protein, partial [Roseovarius sp.]|uniref:hypothetical protein n=1 Tax=Roseovarius sp. TaxID=1486281 RepID=UPI000320C14E